MFLCISTHIQSRRKIAATSGSNGCEILSAISLQLGYFSFVNLNFYFVVQAVLPCVSVNISVVIR